jgi:transposase
MTNAVAELPLSLASRVELVEFDGYRRVYLNGHLVSHYRADDRVTDRIVVTQLAEVTKVSNDELAAMFGMHTTSLSRWRSAARRSGGDGLVPQKRGPKGPSKLTPERCEKIAKLDAEGMSLREIAEALKAEGVEISHVSISNALVATAEQTESEASAEQPSAEDLECEEDTSEPKAISLNTPTRYAGAMMLLPLLERLGLWEVLENLSARVRGSRFSLFDTVAAVILGFALRFRSIEDFKNGSRRDLGILLGRMESPTVQTLRINLVSLIESLDPMELNREMFRRYLQLDPVWEGLYYVDSHFMPYYGTHPVPYGWNSKRKHAEPGHTDTYVHDSEGRALFFISKPLNGSLVQSLQQLVSEIRASHGDSPFTLVFDRGGYSGELFAWLSKQKIGYITYLAGRKAKRRYPKNRFAKSWIEHEGQRHSYTVHEKKTRINKAGLVRTILWIDEKNTQLPLLTNLKEPNPAFLIRALRIRWRQENSLKYLSDNYGIDQIIEYGADQENETHLVDNPKRKKLLSQRQKIKTEAEKIHAQIGRNSLAAYTENATELRARLREQNEKLRRVKHQLERAPVKVPIETIPGKGKRSLLRENRRITVNTLKIVGHNAERILARRFNELYNDPDEYLSLFRGLLHLQGSIRRLSSETCEVVLEAPQTPKVREALEHVLMDLNAKPGHSWPGGPTLQFRVAESDSTQ